MSAFRVKCTKFDFRCGVQRSPDPWTALKGRTSKERKRERKNEHLVNYIYYINFLFSPVAVSFYFNSSVELCFVNCCTSKRMSVWMASTYSTFTTDVVSRPLFFLIQLFITSINVNENHVRLYIIYTHVGSNSQLRRSSSVRGGSVAEWLACWTQAQKGPGSNRSRDAVG